MKLEDVPWQGMIAPVYAAELRACSSHLELQKMFDERWPWLPDAGAIAHLLCKRTFFDWKQWVALDLSKAKGQFQAKATQDYWIEGARKYGPLMMPARLMGISISAMNLSVEECTFFRRVIELKITASFFAECDKQFSPPPKVVTP